MLGFARNVNLFRQPAYSALMTTYLLFKFALPQKFCTSTYHTRGESKIAIGEREKNKAKVCLVELVVCKVVKWIAWHNAGNLCDF